MSDWLVFGGKNTNNTVCGIRENPIKIAGLASVPNKNKPFKDHYTHIKAKTYYLVVYASIYMTRHSTHFSFVSR